MNINNIKLNNFYILYYVLILLRSLFILFSNKFKYDVKYIYKIYYIIILYLKLYYIINKLYNNNIIYYNNYNYIYFYIYKYNNIVIKNNYKIIYNNIIEKIIEIKKVSYTIKKGRIKRYKVLLLIGNKRGWIGIGIGKSYNINKAILLAKINGLNNIYYFKYSLLNVYKLKCIYFNSNKLFIKLKFNIYNDLNIKFLLFKYLFECLGYLNCKVIIYYNIINNKYNLLNKLLLVLFNNF
ncbi:apicoplast ribosomal protein S5, putative (apicoplast) [Plasmodium gallinaceum]|uniref:Apicoplast ribosomal protein S5, putative n=1 Tax=Plasmodium gallinaceum TaxID=5849 RepID=H7CDX8_PLAGA|nr:apicoplast ribosomal protein S5, putative [Plasmodium gallinaceum]BAL70748.1 small subunit ribosomal protein 5 [Plasmodium gallinaceum]CRG98237.1 apicoplast ribosomal protein S5, putative [Plasmodium gallinaceum]